MVLRLDCIRNAVFGYGFLINKNHYVKSLNVGNCVKAVRDDGVDERELARDLPCGPVS